MGKGSDVAPSWQGETAVGTCPEGHRVNIPDTGGETRRGHCPGCEAQRTFEYWRGPVVVV